MIKIITNYLFGFSDDDGIANSNHDDNNYDYNHDTEDNDKVDVNVDAFGGYIYEFNDLN